MLDSASRLLLVSADAGRVLDQRDWPVPPQAGVALAGLLGDLGSAR